MLSFDLYGEFYNQCQGNMGGDCARNGVMLFGRVNDEIKTLPSTFDRYAESFDSKFKLFSFDIFAIQLGMTPSNIALAADGRIAVVLPSTQKPHEITAITCKLFYGRPKPGITAALDANIVVGCYYVKNEDNFELAPCQTVRAEDIHIAAGDIPVFIKNLVEPEAFVSAQIPYPHRIGVTCPILAGYSAPMPYFYGFDGKALTFFRAFLDVYNAIHDKHLAYSYSDWTLNPALDAALGYSDGKLRSSRFNAIAPPAILGDINKALSTAKTRMDDTQKHYFGESREDFAPILNDYCDKVREFLHSTWNSNAYGKTGQARAKSIAMRLMRSSYSASGTISDEIDDIFKKLPLGTILDALFGVDYKNDLAKYITSTAEMFPGYTAFDTFLAFVFDVLGIKTSFEDLTSDLEAINAVAYVMFKCPYALTYKSSRLKIRDLDLLSCFLGVANNPQVALPLRSVAFMHSQLMDNKDSIIHKLSRLQINFGYMLSKRDYDNYSVTKSLLNEEQIGIAKYIFGRDIDYTLLNVASVQHMWNGTFLAVNCAADWVLSQYVRCGLGVVVRDEYLMDLDHAIQFTYINNRLVSATPIRCDEISTKEIAAFESRKGIILEEEQKSAVQLLKNRVSCLIGTAGSGKTTTIELLISTLVNHLGIEPDHIVCIAPTGMAARRMSQCTGYSASTIHSRLKIENEVFHRDEKISCDKTLKGSVIIVDESSMISMPLLYKALQRIPEACRIIFIGDIEQLPPIEVGKPFADMIRYLPMVRLSVSKRAKEGSDITANCTQLVSGGTTFKDGSDCKFVFSACDDNFGDYIADLCKYHIGKLRGKPKFQVLEKDTKFKPEDIQIVTPVAKGSYSWGTTRLNDSLHDVFNPKKRGMMGIIYRDSSGNDIELREGDRVILGANNYDALVFDWVSESDLTLKTIGKGILNGDIGYVKKIVDVSELNILREDESGELKPDVEALKSLGGNTHVKRLRVLIEFKGLDGAKCIAALSAQYQGSLSFGVKVSAGSDLRSLSLAYAITVHKMQGSQAKLVIAPLFSCKARNFISKNLVYTAWSRAQEGLYVIGDISSRVDSALMTAQRVDSLKLKTSPFDIL